MLVIRLSRTGRKKYPTYRIVAADSRRAATGKFVMILGHYNPHSKELVINQEATMKYIENGAQPSNSVVKLLQSQKVKLPDWVQLQTKKRAPKKEAAPVEAAAPAESAPAAEADSTEPEAAAEPVESVAAVATEQAETVEEQQTPADEATTAASDEADAKAAEAASEAAAEVADNSAE